MKERKYDEALLTHQDLMRRALDVYGGNTEPYNMYLINYEVVLKGSGQIEKAEALSDSIALVLEEMNVFDDDYFNFLYNRSVLLYEKGLCSEAKKIALSVLNEYEAKYSIYHPSYLRTKLHYGECLHSCGEREQGFEVQLSACETILDNSEQVFGTLTEMEKSQYIEEQQRAIKRVYAQFYGTKHVIKDQVSRLSNISLRLKSLVLNHSLLTLRRIEKSNGELQNKLKNLKNYRSAYAKVIYLSQEDRLKRGLSPSSLLAKIRFLEKELVQLSGVNISTSDFEWQDIKKQLGPREAAIEILHSPADDRVTAESTYEAIIIRQNSEQPIFVSIGEDNLMDSKYYVGFTKAVGYKIQEGLSYDRYWKPLDDYLLGISKVYYTGEGIYHKLSISALYDKAAAQFLGDRLDIVNVSSLMNARQFSDAKLKHGVFKKNTTLELFGNPDFYNGAVKGVNTYTIDHHVTRSKIEIRAEWGDLPGAEKEVLDIKALCDQFGFSANIYLNDQATEERVKAVRRPGILHIATHGFYEYNDDTVSSNNSVHSYIHPMLSSAVLLKSGGVSYGLRKKHSLSNAEDGILCAFEVQDLDLSET